MRLIDADALERMGYVLTRTYRQDKETMVYETKELSDVPSVEPQRKKGQWKLLVNGDAICSECGRKQKGVWDFDNWDNFCRHCGCDMRGESDG